MHPNVSAETEAQHSFWTQNKRLYLVIAVLPVKRDCREPAEGAVVISTGLHSRGAGSVPVPASKHRKEDAGVCCTQPLYSVGLSGASDVFQMQMSASRFLITHVLLLYTRTSHTPPPPKNIPRCLECKQGIVW